MHGLGGRRLARPWRWCLSGVIGLGAIPSTAVAGPPYETDDPEPTELGHFEIYAFSNLEGAGGDRAASGGFDLNYGPVKDLQLTATLPVAYDRARGAAHWSGGVSDIEVGAKYRFYNDRRRKQSVAIFPRIIAPTARKGFGTGRMRLRLPIWGQQDFGKWSVFGGGGYEINPGAGNRNFWQAGLVVTRDLGHCIAVGGEITHQGPDADDAEPRTALGIGSIIHIRGPYSLLISAGPSFTRSQSGLHAYTALGINF